jgi:SsrA-binding protein
MSTLAINKRARFDYEILEEYSGGLVLAGHEVKSARAGNVSLKGAFVTIRDNEAWLINAHIGAYPKAGPLPGYDPTRSRKLLMHRREIATLLGKRKQAGLTLLPLSLYTHHNRVKLRLGLGRGKKKYEKRETIQRRETDRVIRSFTG